MSISITHPFVSAKGDGGDATLVRPSNWNAAHATSMATGNLIGRLTAGAGAFEEIPLTAYIASLFGATDKAELAGLLGIFETGDVKYTFKTTASAGWLLVTSAGSIGNAASTATLRANADCLDLFVLIYTACADGIAPVSGGRTGNATNDFNSGKRLTIPQLVGRSPLGAGSAGTGTSARTLGSVVGAETHTLSVTEIPSHAHALTDPGHSHTYIRGNISGQSGASGTVVGDLTPGVATSTSLTGITMANTGGGGAHNIMHPVIPLNAMVKL